MPIPSTIHPDERETRAGSAVTPGGRDTPLDREPVVHRTASYDAAGRLARRVAERPHAVAAKATTEAFSDRDDPAGGPRADRLVVWSVPDGGGDPPTGTASVGRGVRPGGGAVPATAAR